jgi:hypothetical protein
VHEAEITTIKMRLPWLLSEPVCSPPQRRLQCKPMRKPRLCLCLLLACSVPLLAQSWRDNRAQLCFERPENNGGINILASFVRFLDYSVPLIGGQAVCIFVDPGSNDLLVTSTIPYDPESTDEEACKSPVKRLQLAPNENRVFTIWPVTKGSTYVCGWRIEPVHPLRSNSKKTKRP